MKLKIDNESLAEEFFEDSRLLGIVAPLKYYQFAWHINQALGFRFRVNNNLEIQLRKKQRNYFFPVAEHLIPQLSLVHYLYNNQYDGEFLLPEFKHLDFLWLTKGPEISQDDFSELSQALKIIPGVQLVTEMTPDKIKNKQHLIL